MPLVFLPLVFGTISLHQSGTPPASRHSKGPSKPIFSLIFKALCILWLKALYKCLIIIIIYIVIIQLNTYVTKVLLLPLVLKGQENHFPTGILQWNLHHNIIILQKKSFKNVVPFQNGGQITDFYVAPF